MGHFTAVLTEMSRNSALEPPGKIASPSPTNRQVRSPSLPPVLGVLRRHGTRPHTRPGSCTDDHLLVGGPSGWSAGGRRRLCRGAPCGLPREGASPSPTFGRAATLSRHRASSLVPYAKVLALRSTRHPLSNHPNEPLALVTVPDRGARNALMPSSPRRSAGRNARSASTP